MSAYKHPVFPSDYIKKTYGKDIRVIRDRVLIVKLPKERLMESDGSSIVRPYTSGRISSVRNNYGQVLKVGPDVKEIKEGWIVKWGDYAGMDIRFEAHFDLSDEGSVTTQGAEQTPQDRAFVVLREEECQLAFLVEDGEQIPEVHDV